MEWGLYQKRHPGGPFATLIAIATTYLHPEAGKLELLQERAKDDDGCGGTSTARSRLPALGSETSLSPPKARAGSFPLSGR